MNNKNFLETAILNQTGLWNGYAMVQSKYSIEPNIDSITRLLGFNVIGSSLSRVEKLFRLTYGNTYSTTLFEAPKTISNIIVVDRNLEDNYGIISLKSLKAVKQCNLEYSEQYSNTKERDYHRKLSDFKLWLLFNVKPSIKLEGRSFHNISVWLRYIDNHYERNIPQFEFQVNVPQCFVKESIKNPDFIKEIGMKIGFLIQ